MPSRMSLFNKEMILQVGRNVGWISVIYFLGLLFALPIRMMMIYSEEEYRAFGPVDGMFHFDFELQVILYLTVPVLLAVFLYRFLHVKQAADLIHSLPVKRAKIFHFYTLTGFVYLILPVLFISFITIFVHRIYDLNLQFQLVDIAVWTGTVILFNTVFYMAGVFVAMVTGISVVHGVLTYVLLLFPAGFTILIIYNLGMILYGFPTNYYQVINIEKITPVTHLTWLNSEGLSKQAIGIYLSISVVLYVLSLIIYKKRKIESASEAIAFSSLKAFFKYGVTFCSMLLGGMYFNSAQNQEGWMVFGYVVGAILGYFIAEMILQKTWRVFKKIKGLALFAGAMIILLLIIQSYTPYERKVPAASEIKSVLMTNMIYSSADDQYAPKPLLEPENIENVINLHNKIIKNEKTNELNMNMNESNFFIYELENGKKIVRQYEIDPEDYQAELAAIRNSLEYKHATNQLFNVKASKVGVFRISDGSIMNKSVTISDPLKIEEAFALLKQEIEDEKYEWEPRLRGNQSQIEIIVGPNKFYNAELKPTYKKLIQWLSDNELLEQAMVTSEDLDYIVVTNETFTEEDLKLDPEREVMERILSDKNALKITNHSQLKTAMENAGYAWFGEEPYVAVFVYKNANYRELRSFSGKYAPEFVVEHFK